MRKLIADPRAAQKANEAARARKWADHSLAAHLSQQIRGVSEVETFQPFGD